MGQAGRLEKSLLPVAGELWLQLKQDYCFWVVSCGAGSDLGRIQGVWEDLTPTIGCTGLGLGRVIARGCIGRDGGVVTMERVWDFCRERAE